MPTEENRFGGRDHSMKIFLILLRLKPPLVFSGTLTPTFPLAVKEGIEAFASRNHTRRAF